MSRLAKFKKNLQV